MKNLYNKTTGQKVIITKINTSNNHVGFDVFDLASDNIEPSKTEVHKFTTFQIADKFFETVSIHDECLAKLAEEKLTDFIVEEENQNWLIDSKSIRMLIPIEWLNEVLISDNLIDVAEVITREQRLNAQSTEKHIFKGDKYFTAYYSSISQTPNENGKSDFEIMMPHVMTEQNLEGKIIVEQKD